VLRVSNPYSKGENFWIKRFKMRNRVNPTSGVISNVYCLINQLLRDHCWGALSGESVLNVTEHRIHCWILITQDMRGDLDD